MENKLKHVPTLDYISSLFTKHLENDACIYLRQDIAIQIIEDLSLSLKSLTLISEYSSLEGSLAREALNKIKTRIE